jgi:NADP-dependent 3-hydroxy acid dehydrogenase YdfG
VTSQESVVRFAETVQRACPHGVSALINNAGVMRIGLMEISPIDDLATMFDINAKGIVHAFLCAYMLFYLWVQQVCTW